MVEVLADGTAQTRHQTRGPRRGDEHPRPPHRHHVPDRLLPVGGRARRPGRPAAAGQRARGAGPATARPSVAGAQPRAARAPHHGRGRGVRPGRRGRAPRQCRDGHVLEPPGAAARLGRSVGQPRGDAGPAGDPAQQGAARRAGHGDGHPPAVPGPPGRSGRAGAAQRTVVRSAGVPADEAARSAVRAGGRGGTAQPGGVGVHLTRRCPGPRGPGRFGRADRGGRPGPGRRPGADAVRRRR